MLSVVSRLLLFIVAGASWHGVQLMIRISMAIMKAKIRIGHKSILKFPDYTG